MTEHSITLAEAVREFNENVDTQHAYTEHGRAAISKYATDVAVALYQFRLAELKERTNV